MTHLHSSFTKTRTELNMSAILFCLMFLMGCSTSVGDQPNPENVNDQTDYDAEIPMNWHVTTTDDQSVKIAFPGAPKQNKTAFNEFPVETYVFTASGHTYILGVMDFSQNPQEPGSHQETFKACADGFQQTYSIQDNREFRWHELPTVEISFSKTIDNKTLSGISRLLFSTTRNITLTKIGPGSVTEVKKDADLFFNSLLILDPFKAKQEAKQNEDNWKKIAGADNRFTFNMPGEPTVKKLKIGGEDFFRYLLLEDETYFIAIYNAGWHSGLDGWIEGLQGNDTLVWKKDFKHEGYPAVKYVIKYHEPGDKVAHFTGQCVLVGDTLYSVAMKGPAAPSEWDDSHPFFNSFNLTELAKKKSNH